ncbi:HDOD domain-containing protein [Treponema sp. OttesenSCG-928-L16]|nr:HDOD domain-containing protein [Treponema sp. OttesenSCG-928-L16]
MSDDISRKLDEYIRNMPSLPTTVSKVLEVCNNPNTSPADLNHVISLDPVLVGRVLKLINSAYYGLGQQVTSLVRAIIMLGINTVKNLALSTAVLGNLSSKKDFQALNMEGFWRHSLCVGVAAKIIARKRGIDPKLGDEYFTAGLLHDIGKIPFGAVLSKEYMLTIALSDRERIPLHQAEAGTLGIDHCGVGKMIVQAWRLDGAVGDAIVYHHSLEVYEGEHRDVLYSTAVANRFAEIMEIGFSGNRCPDKVSQEVWEYLGITRDIYDEIEPVVNGEIEKAKVFLRLQ